MCELVVPTKRELDGHAEAFNCHYGNRAYEGADGNVNNRILATVSWCDNVDHNQGKHQDGEAVHEKT